MPTQKQNSYGAEQFTQLQKQLVWYKSFFEYAADAALIVQPETWSVLDANDYATRLFGMPRGELLGATFVEFRKVFKQLSQSGAPAVLSEMTLNVPDGGTVTAEVSARFVEYDGQRLIQAIARDITEQRALNDKMMQADKMVLLGQLSAGVAHEIRNPLAAINLNLQLLQRKVKPAGIEANYLQIALQGVERITRIVEATLDFSRQPVPVTRLEDINETVRTSIDFVAPSFARKTITVEVHYAESIPQVMADAKQLQQVFVNLLTNAADAIRAKGRIIVKTYIERDAYHYERRQVVAAISDNGAGIPDDDIDRIFEPFFTRKADGTGLGLPISRKIVQQHHGDIEVESLVGAGTTFFVKLPASIEI
ncbi:hypothetical protein MASR2M18_02150 [Ignavibacteria bacterium]|nr:PAS domain S-box protein [Bacteroidota bacterium]MCZ2132669.1 PAS domain S-box protein [Bacteroidota bacterium]